MKTQRFTQWLMIPLSILLIFGHVQAQRIAETQAIFDNIRSDSAQGLEIGIGVGLDFSTLSLINPRPNEGQNTVGFGGLLNIFVNHTGKRWIWDNRLNLQLAAQRLGDRAQPFTKTADVLQFNSLLGRKLFKKIYLAGMVDLRTQCFFTYGNGYLDSYGGKYPLTSEPFSPATLKVLPGLLYRPNSHVKVLFSVISSKANIVANDLLAAQTGDNTEGVGLLGNPNSGDGQYANADVQLGAELRGEMTKKFFKDKIIVMSIVDLYSNYLKNPQNIAFEWYNSIDLVVFKNISINLKSDWFYDHNVLVKIGGDENHLGRRMFIRNGAFLKFNTLF
ncbi:MAG: DUF3078 domain-containing protein [Saprospiraceae bacterium]|nr:DUF3078 domain-containing protein [Saprospiraceae bacterium]